MGYQQGRRAAHAARRWAGSLLSAGTLAALVAVVCCCGQAAASSSLRCVLPHGAEGNISLGFRASGIGCMAARPVVRGAEEDFSCNLARRGGCRVRAFDCRDVHPVRRGGVEPGDPIVCALQRARISFYMPG